jgi:hypothetical protein
MTKKANGGFVQRDEPLTYFVRRSDDEAVFFTEGTTYLSTPPKSWRDDFTEAELELMNVSGLVAKLVAKLDEKSENTIHLTLTNPTPLASLAERLQKGHLDE